MEWEHLFESHILERGWDYYENEYVQEILKEENGIKAWVEGSDLYQVHIGIADGEIINMTCTCPYAEGGLNCKHMAAVLYMLEEGCVDMNEDSSALNRDKNKPFMDAYELVKGAEEDLVRKFLADILISSEVLMNRFKIAVSQEISEDNIRAYKRQIDQIFRKYEGRGNFIDYYHASGFILELYDFLCEDIRTMLSNKQYEAAFLLSTYLFVEVGNIDMDDSDGGTGMISDECQDIWFEILEESADERLEQKMFQWFMNSLDGSVIDYMEDYIEGTLFEYFKENKYMEEKLKLTDKMIKSASEKKDAWNSDRLVGYWVKRHMDILVEMNIDKSEIDAFCRRYWNVAEIRKIYIEKSLNEKNYIRAIEILNESKKIDAGLRGLVHDYSIKLKELYKLIGDDTAYKDELWKLILDYDKGNLNIFRELKSLYPADEWEVKRQIIFDNYKTIMELKSFTWKKRCMRSF
ncbi:SWIM zinc finger family protein [Sedimentibacter sp.]|uniref:SWIM zinc finger family protein n=1 Tax=Sedimentibacter sp. TaxID=1960295 RepID=UPI002899389F|nr:SWIM zinc finger family protein [Sedimentibacter sp.]